MSLRAWNFSDRSPLRPLTSQTKASFRERVCRRTNCLLTPLTSIAVVILELLCKATFKPPEGQLAPQQDTGRNDQTYGYPQGQKVGRDARGPVRCRKPERVMEGFHGDGNRVHLI